jgi:hypothetical protein
VRPDGLYPGEEPAEPNTPAAPAAADAAPAEPDDLPIATLERLAAALAEPEPNRPAADVVEAAPEPATLTQIEIYPADDPDPFQAPADPPATDGIGPVDWWGQPEPTEESVAVFAQPETGSPSTAPFNAPYEGPESDDDLPPPHDAAPSSPAGGAWSGGARSSAEWYRGVAYDSPGGLPPWAEEILGEGLFTEPADGDPPPIWPEYRELVESTVDASLRASVLRAGWLALHARIGEEA